MSSSNCANKRLQCYVEVRNVFDQSIKNNFKAYENLLKIAFGQEDDFTADCLLDYPYFLFLKKILS